MYPNYWYFRIFNLKLKCSSGSSMVVERKPNILEVEGFYFHVVLRFFTQPDDTAITIWLVLTTVNSIWTWKWNRKLKQVGKSTAGAEPTTVRTRLVRNLPLCHAWPLPWTITLLILIQHSSALVAIWEVPKMIEQVTHGGRRTPLWIHQLHLNGCKKPMNFIDAAAI